MNQNIELEALKNEVQFLTNKVSRLESEQRRLISLIFKLKYGHSKSSSRVCEQRMG